MQLRIINDRVTVLRQKLHTNNVCEIKCGTTCVQVYSHISLYSTVYMYVYNALPVNTWHFHE